MLDATTLSRRERGKAERRERIVRAASDLVRHDSFEAVSMVAIAERAGVSPATLYNLFETKLAIFRAVFDLDLETYDELVRAAPASDALERMFVAVDIAAGLYRDQPAFYRAMARAGTQGTALRADIDDPRRAWWQARVAQAAAEGVLRADTDTAVLGVALMQAIRGAFLDWAQGAVTAERLGGETAYALALILRPYVSAHHATALDRRIRALEARLAPPRR